MFFEGAVDKAGSREDKHTGLSQMDSPVLLSGRADLNRRPHGPEPCALAGLSHAP